MSAAPASPDTFKCRKTLKVGAKTYEYFSLPDAEQNGLAGISRLPTSLKVLIENLLRYEDGRSVKADDIRAVVEWLKDKTSTREIAYRPARVLMQDFTGVPAVVDLAAMRDAMKSLGGDPSKINPLVPVDLVIDHSVQVDFFGSADAFAKNVEIEYERNKERYEFLRWGAGAFNNFRVVPPGTGICHQVNLEYLAQTVWTKPPARLRAGLPRHLRRHRQPHHHGQRASACSAGASAASRPRRPCSASPSPWSSPRSSASASRASSRRASPPPIWC